MKPYFDKHAVRRQNRWLNLPTAGRPAYAGRQANPALFGGVSGSIPLPIAIGIDNPLAERSKWMVEPACRSFTSFVAKAALAKEAKRRQAFRFV